MDTRTPQPTRWCSCSTNRTPSGSLTLTYSRSLARARSLSADPMVLMFHKPLALWPRQQRGRIYKLFEDYVKLGGLWGILSGLGRHTGTSPSEFLVGKGKRTILFTSLKGEKVPSVVERVVTLDASWDIRVRDTHDESCKEEEEEEEEAPEQPSSLGQKINKMMRSTTGSFRNFSTLVRTAAVSHPNLARARARALSLPPAAPLLCEPRTLQPALARTSSGCLRARQRGGS